MDPVEAEFLRLLDEGTLGSSAARYIQGLADGRSLGRVFAEYFHLVDEVVDHIPPADAELGLRRILFDAGYVVDVKAPTITCPTCGKVSYNPGDIRERYCGNCHKFHEDMARPG